MLYANSISYDLELSNNLFMLHTHSILYHLEFFKTSFLDYTYNFNVIGNLAMTLQFSTNNITFDMELSNKSYVGCK